MKYWAYLAAKLVVWALLVAGMEWYIRNHFAHPLPYRYGNLHPFAVDLTYTFIVFGFWLISTGLLWGVIWDQRYRCRTCVRHLRMPITTGSWKYIILAPPRLEWICPFGHGTLKENELQLEGAKQRDWQPHEDYWKELVSLEETKK
ncbi:MAG: hypothetical protein ABI823_21575 [Bryobacteraceae bacterium]